MSDYDEFGLFHENIAEFDLDLASTPMVQRVAASVAERPERLVSALKWGEPEPRLVFLHGSGQNAHTWDTVALALGRPLLAIDLPGHGHSDWRADRAYDPATMAADIAGVVAGLAPDADAVVGMSLGGLTAMHLAVQHPALVRSLVMVDITPGVNADKTRAVADFLDGPQRFLSFDELLARTVAHHPTRSASSLRRGILHNAHLLPDGSWEWNYDRGDQSRTKNPLVGSTSTSPDWAAMWNDFAAVDCPMLLVRGALSPVVDDTDEAEARRLQPDLVVEVVDGAGHSVQGDRPVELAAVIDAWLTSQ